MMRINLLEKGKTRVLSVPLSSRGNAVKKMVAIGTGMGKVPKF